MNHRPKLSVEFSPLHKKLFFASLGLVMFTWAYTLISILRLPDTIASHFNAHGIPDDFSSKHYIWFVPVLATIMFFSLNYLARFPHQFNYLKKITPANAQHEYNKAVTMMRLIILSISAVFAILLYVIVQISTTTTESQASFQKFLFPVIIIIILGPIIWYLFFGKKK